MRLLASCNLNSDDLIVDAGAGVSTFVEALLAQGHMNITAIDISAEALGALRARLGQDAARVNYVVADLAHDNLQLRDVALWHDRAVLHFFTNPADRETYLATIRRALRSDGYAIIATFAPAGAPQCSGLDVTRYDPGELTELMGSGFELVEAFDYLYQRPDGDVRPFTYTLFRRVGVEASQS
ncbi:MAG: class I SAM-dependent methyltransferase [Dehalococcoidia bacterium]